MRVSSSARREALGFTSDRACGVDQRVTNEIRISGGVVSLVIPAKAEYIALGRLALTGLLRPLAVEPEVIADVKLAFTEACSNSIRHA